MDKIIEDKLQEIYNIFIEKPNKIFETFVDFYGESRVDIQELTFKDFTNWIDTTNINKYITYTKAVEFCNFKGEFSDYLASMLTLPVLYERNLIDDIEKVLDEETTDNIIYSYEKGFILVYFPEVRVTNENNKFVDISKLFVKIYISPTGCMRREFELNRAAYSLKELKSSYMHSHVSNIPFSDFTKFSRPCVGKGPIKNTSNNLNIDYDLDIWSLFCFELDLFTKTESLAGVPFKLLENIGVGSLSPYIKPSFFIIDNAYFGGINLYEFKSFVKYFINNKKLKFNFVNSNYSIGMSTIDFIILVSNEFIEWYNTIYNKSPLCVNFKDLLVRGFLKTCVIQNNKIYYLKDEQDDSRFYKYQGKKVCTFKGKDVFLNIIDTQITTKHESIIVDPDVCLYILNKILKVINFKYASNPEQYSKNQQTHPYNGTKKEIRYI